MGGVGARSRGRGVVVEKRDSESEWVVCGLINYLKKKKILRDSLFFAVILTDSATGACHQRRARRPAAEGQQDHRQPGHGGETAQEAGGRGGQPGATPGRSRATPRPHHRPPRRVRLQQVRPVPCGMSTTTNHSCVRQCLFANTVGVFQVLRGVEQQPDGVEPRRPAARDRPTAGCTLPVAGLRVLRVRALHPGPRVQRAGTTAPLGTAVTRSNLMKPPFFLKNHPPLNPTFSLGPSDDYQQLAARRRRRPHHGQPPGVVLVHRVLHAGRRHLRGRLGSRRRQGVQEQGRHLPLREEQAHPRQHVLHLGLLQHQGREGAYNNTPSGMGAI